MRTLKIFLIFLPTIYAWLIHLRVKPLFSLPDYVMIIIFVILSFLALINLRIIEDTLNYKTLRTIQKTLGTILLGNLILYFWFNWIKEEICPQDTLLSVGLGLYYIFLGMLGVMIFFDRNTKNNFDLIFFLTYQKYHQ